MELFELIVLFVHPTEPCHLGSVGVGCGAAGVIHKGVCAQQVFFIRQLYTLLYMFLISDQHRDMRICYDNCIAVFNKECFTVSKQPPSTSGAIFKF